MRSKARPSLAPIWASPSSLISSLSIAEFVAPVSMTAFFPLNLWDSGPPPDAMLIVIIA